MMRKKAAAAVLALAVWTGAAAAAGCARGHDPYATVMQVRGAVSELNNSLEGTLRFIPVLETLDIQTNDRIFEGLEEALQASSAAIEEARAQADGWDGIEFDGRLGDLEEEVQAYREEVRKFLDRAEAAAVFVRSLDETLAPLVEAKRAIGEMGDIEGLNMDELYKAVPRIDLLLDTREEVASGIEAIDTPPYLRHLKQGVTMVLDDFYANIRNWKTVLLGQAQAGQQSEEDTEDGAPECLMAIAELPDALGFGYLQESPHLHRIDVLLFEYMVKYRPERD